MYPLASGDGSEQKVSGADRAQYKDVTPGQAGTTNPTKRKVYFTRLLEIDARAKVVRLR
jgi:hypothetical protein